METSMPCRRSRRPGPRLRGTRAMPIHTWHFIDNSAARLATCPRRHTMREPIWHDWREAGTRTTTHLNAPRKQRRFDTLASLREMSQPTILFLGYGDITPEFSGRTMRPRSEHFIHHGPAATRC
jgi:hypothetical protein